MIDTDKMNGQLSNQRYLIERAGLLNKVAGSSYAIRDRIEVVSVHSLSVWATTIRLV